MSLKNQRTGSCLRLPYKNQVTGSLGLVTHYPENALPSAPKNILIMYRIFLLNLNLRPYEYTSTLAILKINKTETILFGTPVYNDRRSRVNDYTRYITKIILSPLPMGEFC